MSSGTAWGPGGFVAPAWALDVTQEDLERTFGPATMGRARTYQRRGVVRDLTHAPDGGLVATVHGTRRYRTTVSSATSPAGRRTRVITDCSCPVAFYCKHAAALILEAQATAQAARLPGPAAPRRGAPPATTGRAEPSTPAPEAWEQLLAPVLRQARAASAPEPVDPGVVPLALQFDHQAERGAPRLAMRPLRLGTSGAWIRTGVSWSDLQGPYPGPLHPAHRQALAAVLPAHRAASRSWYALPDWIWVEDLGRGVWRLLREIADSGVALVTGDKGRFPVTLLPEPLDLSLDLTRCPEGQLTLRPVLDLPVTHATPKLLGDPAHGIQTMAEGRLLLAELSRTATPAVTGLLGRTREVTIPGAAVDRFLSDYYPVLRQQTSIASSDGSVDLPEIVPPRLGLEARFEDDHVTRLRWSFRYAVGDRVHTVPLLHGLPGDVPGLARDAAAEEELLASLVPDLSSVPGLLIPVPGKLRLGVVLEPELGTWATVEFVRHVLPALQERDDIEVTVIGEPLPYREAEEPPLVAVSTGDEDDRDWFSLGVQVSVAGQPVPLPDLLAALTRGEEWMLLQDGTLLSLQTPELHTLRQLVEEARALQDDEHEGLRINRYQAGLWEELVDLGVVEEQSERWQRTVGDLLRLDDLPRPEAPEGLTATLRGYQLDGFRWLSFLWDHEMGGILADDMGLGKTVQALAAAERARETGRLTPERPLLVVAPTSVVPTWQREAERFTPGLRVAALDQTVRRSGAPLAETIEGAHIVVTSYALLRIDADHLTEQSWSAVILDEAQAVKNHRSRTYQAARNLRAPVKFAITGTPLENSLMDLWSLLSLVAPGLFPTPEKFGEIYRKPIESGKAPELLATLRRRVRPLMLRRTKEAVAPDLPPKIEQVVPVPLNPQHRRLYDTHLQRERQRILGLLDDVDRNRIAILAALTKLRQLSLDPHLVLPDAPASVRSSKLDALIEQLTEVVAEGHRCLVFSQFTRFLAVVRQRLVAEGIGHTYLDGRTRDRGRRIAEFTEGDDPVFLISLKAGGSGLTLTEADYVFVLDPWWNPAVEAQAVDRTHRIGQHQTVNVYRLVAEDTVEEKVVALQERKRELFTQVVDDGGLLGAPLTADDIRGLLSG